MSIDPLDAWAAETARLVTVLHDVPDGDWERPSPCPPWTAAELLGHVVAGVARVPGMLDAPAPARAEIDAVGYFRTDERFSGSTNEARIDLGRREAAAGGPELVRRLAVAREDAVGRCRREPPGRVVRTRHGDAMLLGDFLATRVLEAGIHGLDLAEALGREPWLTPAAAALLTRVYGAADRAGLSRLTLG
ncbi:maleylpyruvate isomerase N-terminal domain-containing protein [Dactylosporangium vinaceum]|uniref:Maleylpyruvate isomerase N-terminal domain-containing protein n=1 Tax=Dactylosporangium vinaceum TaxID=53362 RepID=A0ABV5M417_9ACTN|nr:maleylpyruvate isomerase N-terminal domain-containing protein [Dactylosporangium vinaceum]UAB93490.1 maleylpyruvate isomerase N-terminal domain-containing protein [Dactylosporangium vinaceum]